MNDAPAARELVLVGSPFDLVLPDVCGRCGSAARGRLDWEKVFPGDSDKGPEVCGARAPFCAECLAQHEREVKRMPPLESFFQCFRSEAMIPAVLSGAATVWLLLKFVPRGYSGDWVSAAVFAALVAFFALISWGSYQAARDATRHHTVPPLTTVTASFGFSQDTSNLFEGGRCRYQLVNDAFYEALREANRDRVWKASGDRALSAANKRISLYVVLGALAAAAVLWDWLGPG
jgi:hypothetical protein